ncbi:alkaline phosphatase family protein [Cerasicoccus frondis]|uniref:alkaline phosphatase family protein n=1 Tax=Cerasicoccus frondis TaxID=490090 RepID=UPI002852B8DF|nr:alkaline phosphatase family protein [Cerasicoccus frondis]
MMAEPSVIVIFLSGATATQVDAFATRLPGHIAGDLSFPLRDKAAALLTSVMTGLWPDQHGVLLPEMRDRETNAFRRLNGGDRRGPAFWERLALEGTPTIAVGWPFSLPAVQQESMQVMDAAFGSGQVSMPSAVFPDTASGQRAESLFEAWLQPDELPADFLASLAPTLMASDNRETQVRVATMVAENVSRHAAFLELISDGDYRVATLHLDLLAQFQSLAVAGEVPDGLLALMGDFLAAIFQILPGSANVILAGIPMHASDAPGRIVFQGVDFVAQSQTLGVSVLDLAPTVWALAGFVEMRYPGRPIMEALKPEVMSRVRKFKASWRPGDGRDPFAAEQEVIAMLSPPGLESARLFTAHRLQRWQADWNLTLIRSFVARSAYLEVLPIADARTRDFPEETDLIKILAECLLRAELPQEALAAAEEAGEVFPADDPDPLILAASARAAMGNEQSARELLTQAGKLSGRPTDPLRIARLFEWLEDWPAVLKCLETYGESMLADQRHYLSARANFGLGHWETARDEALEAIELNYANPHAHEILGQALWKLNDRPAAMTAFSTCVCQAPNRAWPFQRLTQYGPQAGSDPHDVDYWQLQAELAQDKERQLVADYRDAVARYRKEGFEPRSAPQRTSVRRRQRPANIIGVTGLPGAGQNKILQRLAENGHPLAKIEAVDWPAFCGASDESRQLEPGLVYDFPLGLLDCLPREHEYRLIVCLLKAEMITGEYAVSCMDGLSPAIDAAELTCLLLSRQQQMLTLLDRMPNVSATLLKDAPEDIDSALSALLI